MRAIDSGIRATVTAHRERERLWTRPYASSTAIERGPGAFVTLSSPTERQEDGQESFVDAIDRARNRPVGLSATTQSVQETAERLSTAIESGHAATVSVSAAIDSDSDGSFGSSPAIERDSRASVSFSNAMRGDLECYESLSIAIHSDSVRWVSLPITIESDTERSKSFKVGGRLQWDWTSQLDERKGRCAVSEKWVASVASPGMFDRSRRMGVGASSGALSGRCEVGRFALRSLRKTSCLLRRSVGTRSAIPRDPSFASCWSRMTRLLHACWELASRRSAT